MNNTLQLHTPEGISFTIPLASPLMRFFAWSIDFFAIMVIMAVVDAAMGLLKALAPDTASALLVLASFLVYLGYAMVLEWRWQGQTIGKRFCRLRVVDSHGLRLSVNQVIVRNLLRAIDSLPAFYLVGGLAAFVNPLSQRLGDMVANTVVIHTPSSEQPDLAQLTRQKFNSLRSHPRQAALLRQRLSPQEAELGLKAVLRRDEFDDQARLALFDELATYYSQKVSLPDEAVAGLTSEQQVRNVVEILYN